MLRHEFPWFLQLQYWAILCRMWKYRTIVHVGKQAHKFTQPSHQPATQLDGDSHGGEPSQVNQNSRGTQMGRWTWENKVWGTMDQNQWLTNVRVPMEMISREGLVPVRIYRVGEPQRAPKVYAILDDQSNSTLGCSDLFDLLTISKTEPYYFTLTLCSGHETREGLSAWTGHKLWNYRHSMWWNTKWTRRNPNSWGDCLFRPPPELINLARSLLWIQKPQHHCWLPGTCWRPTWL